MKRTIVIEVDLFGGIKNSDVEREMARVLDRHWTGKIINIECADGTPAEAFGIGKEKS